MSIADRFTTALTLSDCTLAALVAHAGCSKQTGAAIVHRMRKAKEMHICKWLMADPAGGRLYPRPVYRLGPGEDAEKPARKPRDRDRHRPITRVASVFHLGGAL